MKEEEVKLARAEEMEEVRKHNVYVKVPIEHCLRETGKMPIGTRWVDINKGDDVNLEYRSRLVAQELKKKVSLRICLRPPRRLKQRNSYFQWLSRKELVLIGRIRHRV